MSHDEDRPACIQDVHELALELAEDVIRDRYHVCQTEPEAVKALFGKPEVRYAAG